MAAGAGNGPAVVAMDVGGDKQLMADAAAATAAELDIFHQTTTSSTHLTHPTPPLPPPPPFPREPPSHRPTMGQSGGGIW